MFLTGVRKTSDPKIENLEQTDPNIQFETTLPGIDTYIPPKKSGWIARVQQRLSQRRLLAEVEEIASRMEGTPYDLARLNAIAETHPRTAEQLVTRIFERGDLVTRLRIFRSVLVSETLGDGKLVGELFVKLMAATTDEERREMVEPALESLLYRSASLSPAAANKRNWLHALIHGWREEI